MGSASMSSPSAPSSMPWRVTSGRTGTSCRASHFCFRMSSMVNALYAEVVPFANEIGELLKNVFGKSVIVDITEWHGRFLVRVAPPLELTIRGEALATLTAEFGCTWDSAGTFLAVDKSTIKLSALLDRAPI